MKNNFLDNLVKQLSEASDHMGTFKKDFEKKCHSILNQAFTKFDLVTREEFDTQTKVLARSRKKLEELETHIKKLEESIKKKTRKSQ